MTYFQRPYLAMLVSMLAFSGTAQAVTITWTGGAGTNSWHTAANWDLNRVPAAGDDVVIPDMSPDVTVTYSTGSTTITSLTSTEAFRLQGGTLTIDAASTLNGAFIFTGTLAGSGDVTVNGAMTWTLSGAMSGAGKTIIGPTASLAISDPFVKTLNRTLENHSPNMNWTPGAGGNFSFNNGTLHNMSDGVFTIDISSSNSMAGVGGTNALINAGILNKTGAGTLNFTTVVSAPVAFNNSGTTNIDAGGLTISNGGSNTGMIDADAGTSLTLSSPISLDPASSLTGQGTLTFSGSQPFTVACVLSGERTININATVNFNAPYTLPGTVNLTGTLSGSGDIIVAGPMNWTGTGTMSGTGKTTIAATGSLTISDSFAKFLSRTLENHSANASWTPSVGSAFSFNNGTLINAAGGTLTVNLTANNTLYTIFGTGGTNAVNNAGTFNKIGNGILELKTLSGFPVPFNNSGTTNLDAGGLLIASGGSNTGTIDADAGSTLTLASTVTLDPASALNGQGTLTFTNGANQTVACMLATNRIINILGGTISFDAPYSIDGTINLTGGVLSGTGDITMNGILNWTGSQMAGTGKTIIAPSGTLTMGGPSSLFLSRVLENHSPNATWTPNSGNTLTFNNGTLINAADGVFTANPTANNTLHRFFSNGGTNAVINAGTFNKTGAGILSFSTFSTPMPLNNSGTVNVDVGVLTLEAGGTNTGVFDADAGTTLTIASAMTFDPASSILGTGTLTFTNGANQTIACTLATNRIINILAGIISFNAPYTLTGTLNATGGALSGTADLTINGIMNWTGSQMAGTGRTIVAPSGTLNMGPNSLTLSRVLENHSPNATWAPGNGNSVTFNNGTLINAADGTFTANPTANNTLHNFFSSGDANAVTNAGTFVKTGNGILSFSTFSTPLPFTNTGTIRVVTNRLSLLTLTNFSGTTLTGGIYDVIGTLQFTGANIVTNAANIILDGPTSAVQNTANANALANFATNEDNGTFELKNGRNFALSGAIGNAGLVRFGPGDNTFSSPTFTNSGTVRKAGGAGTGSVNSSLTQAASGVLDAETGILSVSALTNFSGNTLTGGTYRSAATLRIGSANIVNNAASIVLDGPASAIQDTLGVDAIANLAATLSGGALQIRNGRDLALPGDFSNAGQVTIGPGDDTLSLPGTYTQSAGTTLLDGGTLDPANNVDIQGGELKGNGVVEAHVQNGGTCRPGLSAGVLTINGDYQQMISGALEVELGGTTAGTQYDQLSISGTALLAGALRVLPINGFQPDVNDTFDVLTAAQAEVKFQTIQLPILTNLRGLRFADLPDRLRLSIIDCGPGDADGDGVGDACDTPPELKWHTIDGGGGTSSGGIFKLSATIGQPDACAPDAPMTGGIFTLVGGFWPGVEIVDDPGCTLPGDVNLDGLRNGRDITTFAACVIGGATQDCACADVNASGSVDAADMVPFVQLLINQ